MKNAAFTKTYGGRTVLSMPEYAWEKGKIYAIIGANGSGKSTLARVLAGVERADGGAVPLRDEKVRLMPQKSFAFRMSTEKNILLGSRDGKRAESLMEELAISHLRDKNARRLSGGETARMALARILMTDGEMLILDEPTTAMDMESTAVSEELIRRTCRERNCTVLLVTHSLQQAKRLADAVLFFHNGELKEHGEKAKLLAEPATPELRVFLDFYGQ